MDATHNVQIHGLQGNLIINNVHVSGDVSNNANGNNFYIQSSDGNNENNNSINIGSVPKSDFLTTAFDKLTFSDRAKVLSLIAKLLKEQENEN